MKETIKKLQVLYFAYLAMSSLIFLLFSYSGIPEHDATSPFEFYISTIDVILSILIIPFALKLFKFKKVHDELITNKSEALLRYGIFRMALLENMLLLNTGLYAILFGSPTYGYLAIIFLIAIIFIYPSRDRCYSEVGMEYTED